MGISLNAFQVEALNTVLADRSDMQSMVLSEYRGDDRDVIVTVSPRGKPSKAYRLPFDDYIPERCP